MKRMMTVLPMMALWVSAAFAADAPTQPPQQQQPPLEKADRYLAVPGGGTRVYPSIWLIDKWTGDVMFCEAQVSTGPIFCVNPAIWINQGEGGIYGGIAVKPASPDAKQKTKP